MLRPFCWGRSFFFVVKSWERERGTIRFYERKNLLCRYFLPFLSLPHLADYKNKGEMTMDMKERLQELAENARVRIEESEGLDKLNDVRVAYLGKK